MSPRSQLLLALFVGTVASFAGFAVADSHFHGVTGVRTIGTGTATGPASGDLSGSYPAPSVVGLNGAAIPIAPATLIERNGANTGWQTVTLPTSTTSGDLMQWTGTAGTGLADSGVLAANVVQTSRNVIAGTGLVGCGLLTSDITCALSTVDNQALTVVGTFTASGGEVVGADSAAAPQGGTIRGGNALGGTANVNAGTLVISGGKPTGTGSSQIMLTASPAGSNGGTGPIAPTAYIIINQTIANEGTIASQSGTSVDYAGRSNFVNLIIPRAGITFVGGDLSMNTHNINSIGLIGYNGQWWGTSTVAATGSTGGNAAALPALDTSDAHAVSISACNAAKGVKLPAGAAQGCIQLMNQSSTATNTCLVYPDSGGTINGGSANASYAQNGGTSLTYCSAGSSTWTTY